MTGTRERKAGPVAAALDATKRAARLKALREALGLFADARASLEAAAALLEDDIAHAELGMAHRYAALNAVDCELAIGHLNVTIESEEGK